MRPALPSRSPSKSTWLNSPIVSGKTASSFPPIISFDSSVDGITYNGFEAWIEYRVGWKFEFAIGDRTLFITPQPGFGHALYLQKIWPGLNASTYRQGSLAFIPQILLGLEL